MGIGWTRTHGFFLQMGGFCLRKPDGSFHRLSFRDFRYLLLARRIDFPTITEEEIDDKSKADVFAKTLVLIQTLWFVMQCIGRAIQGLGITELEISTLAFAAFNGVTYFLWWYKPLNVKCAVLLDLKPVARVTCQSLPRVENEEPTSVGSAIKSRFSFDDPPLVDHTPSLTHSDYVGFDTELGPDPTIQARTKKTADIWNTLQMIFGYPLLPILSSTPSFMYPDPHLTQLCSLRSLHTFHADSTGVWGWQFFPMVLSTCAVFGGIHCLAWNFHFPSVVEQRLWQASSLAIIGLPVYFALGLLAVPETYVTRYNWLRYYVQVTNPLMAIIYIISRVTIVVLAFTSLRNLPSSVYLTASWTDFLPHV